MMSESKHPAVIHYETKKIVTAFKLENDLTWVGKERNKFIALPIYCKDNQEIEMTFVKSFERKGEIDVMTHFRKKIGEEDILSEIGGESEEHRRAKENIYGGIYSGKIKIDGKVLGKECIDDIKIEYRTSSKGYVIPDIIILLKKTHPKYGLGIFIEIQFSSQKEERTNERSYERVIRGFSGIWLNQNDFFIGKLNRDNLEIESHKKLLKKLEKIEDNKFIKRLNRYGELIDSKLENFSYKLEEKFKLENEKLLNINNNYLELNKQIKNEIKSISEEKINNLKIEQEKLEELKEELNNLDIDLSPYVKRVKELISKDTKLWAEIIIDSKIKIEEYIKSGDIKISSELYDNLKKDLIIKLKKDLDIGNLILNYHTQNLTKEIKEGIVLEKLAFEKNLIDDLINKKFKKQKEEELKLKQSETPEEKFYCHKCKKNKSILSKNYDSSNKAICWDCNQIKKGKKKW